MPKPRTHSEIRDMLTVKQVADDTGTSEASVRRWIARGRLRAYYVGTRNIRIDPADLHTVVREVAPATFAAQNGGADDE